MNDLYYEELKNIDFDDCEEIASLSQNCDEYDNYNYKLYRTEDGKVILKEDMCSDSNYYWVDNSDITDNNYNDFLKECAMNWAGNGEEDERVQRIAWGFDSPESYAVNKDYKEPVKILSISHYYGYEPISYVKNENGDDMQFGTYAEAAEWIDEQESDIYYLSHGEHSRPDYYIVEN